MRSKLFSTSGLHLAQQRRGVPIANEDRLVVTVGHSSVKSTSEGLLACPTSANWPTSLSRLPT